jgi:hypothetical protein
MNQVDSIAKKQVFARIGGPAFQRQFDPATAKPPIRQLSVGDRESGFRSSLRERCSYSRAS